MVKKTEKIVEEKPVSQDEKKKRIERMIAMTNKKAGKEVIAMATKSSPRDRIPFTSAPMNEMSGGGVPLGAFSVLWGGKSAGKTSSCYDIIAQAQQRGLICQLYDFERSFDPVWAKNFGVDPEYLAIAKFDNAEEGLDNVIDICKDKLADVIIIDSIQGLCPQAEYESKKGKEKSLADDTMGLLQRRLSKFFSKAAPYVDQANCAVILIGQTRMDIGGFIPLEKLTGGNALLHWSSLTINCRRGAKANNPTKKVYNEETEENETVPIGFELWAKVDKSKLGPDEGKEARVPFYFGSGFLPKETK